MAVPSYTEDLTDIDLAEATTNFSALGGGAGGLSADVDFAIQGTYSITKQVTGAGVTKGMVADYGSGITLGADDHVFVWVYATCPGLIDSHSAGGIRVTVGTATNAYNDYYVAGNDTFALGGHVCWPVKYSTATPIPGAQTGTPGANPQWFGGQLTVTGTLRASNLAVDASRYGTGAYITAGGVGSEATFTGFAEQNDAVGSRWGILSEQPGGFNLQGRFVVGQNNTQTPTAAYFDDGNALITFADTPHSNTDFTQIIIDHASTTFNMNNITMLALGSNNPGQLVYNNASTTSALNTCAFDSIGSTTLEAGVTATSCTWRSADNVTQNGAVIESCIFDSSVGSVAMTVSNLDNVDNSTFISNSNHAMELTSEHAGSTFDLNGCTFTGYATADGSTGSEVIYNNSGGSAAAGSADSYSEANYDVDFTMDDVSTAYGQSFTGDGNTLSTADFYLQKVNSPTGNVIARIYAHSGTFGTSSVPTGAALANSAGVDSSTLGATYALEEFVFSGSEQITLTNGTKYVAVVEFNNGDGTDDVETGMDETSPTHGGNSSEFDGAWTASSAEDMMFYVYTSGGDILCDNYSGGGTDRTYNATFTATGQTFTGNGNDLSTATFNLKKTNSPTGNATAKVYAHTGTYGSTGIPTGAVLATSDTIDVSTFAASYAPITFTFTGGDKITLTNATKYCIVVEHLDGDGTDFIVIEADTSSPTHGGNEIYWNGSSWAYDAAGDVDFDVYTGAATGSVIINHSGTTGTISVRNGPNSYTSVVSSVPISITVEDDDGVAIGSAQTAVYLTSDDSEVMNEDTNGSGVASTSYGGSTPADVYFRIRKSSAGDTKYKNLSGVGTIATTTGMDITVTLKEDNIAN